MFNSLPNSLKEAIRSEYHIRLVIVLLIALVVIQVSFLVFLLPSWLISLDKERDVVLQAERISGTLLNQAVDAIDFEIKSINTKLDIVDSVLEYPKFVPYVDRILSKKTNNIFIKELTYTSLSQTTGKISIAGTSITRDSLVSFVKELEGLKIFDKVDLPISNFTKDKNINFSITLAIKL